MTTILDIDSILDNTLDSTPDVPDFVTPPSGDYLIDVTEAKLEKYSKKEDGKVVGDALRIKVTYSVAATTQLADEKDMPVADGSLFTEQFMATEEGLGYFKKSAKKMLNVEDINGVSIRDILSSLKDVKAMPARIKLKVSVTAKGTFENVNITPMWPQEQAAA